MRKHLPTLFGVLCALVLSAPLHASIINGQVDNFQDGTTIGWSGGASPTNIANGGPLGAGDRFLRITSSGGSGPGGSLATYNFNQWTGDYLAESVYFIRADMKNFGTTALQMRVMLMFGDGGDFTSTTPVTLPADGLWHTVQFGLTAADLTNVGGIDDLNLTLQTVRRLMFRHQSGPPVGIGQSTPIAGQLGIDNVRALPEPATLVLVAVGLLALRPRRRAR